MSTQREWPLPTEDDLRRTGTRISTDTARRLSAALTHVPAESGQAIARHLPGWLDSHSSGTAHTYLLRVLVWLEHCACSNPPVDPLRPELDAFHRFTGRVLPSSPVGPEGAPRGVSARAGIESACQSLLHYCHAADVAGVRNRFAEHKRPPRSRRRLKPRPELTTEQFRQLVDAAGRDSMCTVVAGRWGSETPEGTWSPLGPLILGLLGWLGMRIDVDVMHRSVDEVATTTNADGDEIDVLAGPTKGGRPERWDLTPELTRTLRAWLSYRIQLADYYGDVGDALLISPRTGRALSAKQVRSLLRRCATRAGLPPITPHDLRHMFADLARKLGIDERTLQAAMRHARLENTQSYGRSDQRQAARPAEAMRAALSPVWPAPDDPYPVVNPPAPDTCGCGSTPWSVLTASIEPWGYPGQAVVLAPAPDWHPRSASQLHVRCCCGVRYPPSRPVRVTGFVADGATDEFQRMLLHQGQADAQI